MALRWPLISALLRSGNENRVTRGLASAGTGKLPPVSV